MSKKKAEKSEDVIRTGIAPVVAVEATPVESGDTVVASAPKDEMKEISAQEFFARKVSVVPPPSLSNTLRDLVGKPLPEVRDALDALTKDGKIKGFIAVPLGTVMTSEAINGRVQIVKDHQDNVLDIVVG